jgi:uncharacterized protein YegJ (DUF2314 family)
VKNNNIVAICKECTEKRKDDWQNTNKTTKIPIGAFVKIEFREKSKVEHMWVKITKKDKGNFYGTLNSKPTYIKNIKYGGLVFFTRNEIEQLIVKEK